MKPNVRNLFIKKLTCDRVVPIISAKARALEVPMYQLFDNGEAAPAVRKLKLEDRVEWGHTGQSGDYFSKSRKLLAKMELKDHNLILHMAQRVTRHGSRRP
jgi:hypothetical protein